MVLLKPKCTSLIRAAPKPCIWFNVKAPLTMSGIAEIVEVVPRLGELEEVPQLVGVVSTQSVVASEVVAKA